MKKNKYFIKLTFLLLILSSIASSVLAQEHVIIPRFGAIERNDNTNHRVDNDRFDFDNDAVVSIGVTYLYKMETGYAFGLDIFGYDNEVITTTNTGGDVTTAHIYGVVQKFFNKGGPIKPYIGIGVGLVTMSFDANVNGELANDFEDNAVGLSYEIILGSEFEISKKVGLMVEYKYFDFNVDDDIDARNVMIESDGHALFVGVAMHF